MHKVPFVVLNNADNCKCVVSNVMQIKCSMQKCATLICADHSLSIIAPAFCAPKHRSHNSSKQEGLLAVTVVLTTPVVVTCDLCIVNKGKLLPVLIA